jgi:hypothetical protein
MMMNLGGLRGLCCMLLLICFALPLVGYGMPDLSGLVERRPAEEAGERLFEKFGSFPWRGGDPWQSESGLKGTRGGAAGVPAPSPVSQQAVFRLVGTLEADKLMLCDSCNLNLTCNKTLDLDAPPGLYSVYAVTNGSKYMGLFVELKQEGLVL